MQLNVLVMCPLVNMRRFNEIKDVEKTFTEFPLSLICINDTIINLRQFVDAWSIFIYLSRRQVSNFIRCSYILAIFFSVHNKDEIMIESRRSKNL